MQKYRTYIAGAAIFVVAVLFRLWLIHLVPQPFIYDQTEFEYYAQKIVTAPYMLAAHTYRFYPYPLLLALIYKIAGFGNHAVVFTFQAVLDSLTGVLLFAILRLVGKKRAAWVTFVLYSVNPFTSAYAGVILSEVLSTFFTVCLILTGLLLIKKPKISIGFLFGLSAGMVMQTRSAMIVASIVALGSVWFWVSWKSYKRVYVGIAIGLILTALYPLYTNWTAYHELTIFKVDSFYAMELYNGATLKILPPFMTASDFPPQQQIMYAEYWSEFFPNRTIKDRQAMANKYMNMAVTVIKADPVDYIRWRFFKMWYVWQKDNIYTYSEPGYGAHKAWTFWGNTILLAAAAIGIALTFFRRKDRLIRWLWMVSVGIIVLQTFALCFSHAEYRLTIPLYPILFIFAALVA